MAAKSHKFALYVLMFNMFIAMSGIGLIIPIMPEYLDTFGVAGQALGTLVATFALAQFLFSPLSGQLSDKYGRKKLIIFGLIIFGLSQLVFGLASHLWILYLARFFSGLGAAFLIPPMMAFVADITTFEERGKGMGLLGASMSLGFMVGPGFGGFLAEVSLQFPFYVATTVALLAAAISLIALPNVAPTVPAIPVKNENLLEQMKRSVYTPYFVMLLVMLIFAFGLANFQSTIALYVDKKFQFTPKEISVLITIGGFVGVIAQTFVINRLFKRFGEMKVILVNLLVSAGAMIGILFVSTFWTILLVATVFFTAASLLRPAINTLISKLAGKDQGYAAGMNNAYMSLGNMIGPALAGILFDIDMSFPYIFGTAILITCFFIANTWSMRKQQLLAASRS
ncbi:MFS transporter [Planococcus shenhongbingii]|uniref:MFS transporter n=1 Tax=Planococcus shenhongbingii TaxID=3058398 RepID=A0ABT8N8W8_9BACL|nr:MULTISPECIES: MFS transporter [unclassified Planococcus (in: firmicutes)]MDN7244337.1 MFS transporter [Planococcus sp. N017]WKA57505.1 MFS transporter [Planococcus sp. N016]